MSFLYVVIKAYPYEYLDNVAQSYYEDDDTHLSSICSHMDSRADKDTDPNAPFALVWTTMLI